ncbi:glycosyltransferase [Gammaproteobacteria bacterium]|nr:glycosyltransferase [Gammaproteobacteria bacterium]
MKKFSILLPLYIKDKPALFKKALNSILKNTYKPDQIVLVVDGPINDDLENIISDLKDDTFDVIRIKKNQGIINALNTGIEKCKNELVARCDSDDENVLNRFELQLHEFEKDKELVVCGGQIVERSDGKEFYRNVPTNSEDISKYLKLRNPFNHMTVMYKKSKVIEANKYPEIIFREDYALWVRMHSLGNKFMNLDKVLVYATAGMSMYERRGKPADIYHELKLQRFLFNHNVINVFEFIFNLTIRSINMLISPKIRGLIYTKFLRKL